MSIVVAINNSNIQKTAQRKETKNIKLDLQKDLVSLSSNLKFRIESYKGTITLISQINGQPIEGLLKRL